MVTLMIGVPARSAAVSSTAAVVADGDETVPSRTGGAQEARTSERNVISARLGSAQGLSSGGAWAA